MKIAIIILLVASASAARLGDPQGRQLNPNQDIVVIRDIRDGPVEATFNFDLELSNGVLIAESGSPGFRKEGSYSHIAPEGDQYNVDWVADENGYRLVGDPIVESLIRIAEQQRADGITFDEQGFRNN